MASGYDDGQVVDDQIEHSGIFVMGADGRHRREVTRIAPFAAAVEGVQWSPDGNRLVFGVSKSAASKPPGGRALFIVNASGTGQRQLTPWSLGAAGTPDWSAATNLIVFRAVASDEEGKGSFFTIHPDGTSLTPVTHFTDTVISHQVGFSPDGRWIVFSKRGDNEEADVFIAKTDGTDLRPVTKTPQSESSPHWAGTP